MIEAGLTPIQTQILETAALMIQPVDMMWLAKSIRKPYRGIINEAGQLVRKGLLTQGRIPGRYYFSDYRMAKRYNDMLSDEKRRLIYQQLWRAVSSEFPQKASADTLMNVVWAALKSGYEDAETIVSESLEQAFRQADDILAGHIFDLAKDAWPQKYPDPVRIRLAEHQFLRGCFAKSLRILQEIHSDDELYHRQVNVLQTRIMAFRDAGYPVVKQMHEYFRQGYDFCLLAKLVKQVVVLYQESGLLSESQELTDRYFSDKKNYNFDYLWLSSRQLILKGNLDKALTTLQNALKAIERDAHRSEAAFVMLDIAKIHGIRGNPVKEKKCLRIAEYLMRRAKRGYFEGKLFLYKIEMALDSKNWNEAIHYIKTVLYDRPDAGKYELAVAEYAGMILANRWNSPKHFYQYADSLFKNIRLIPGEMILKIYHSLDRLTVSRNSEKTRSIMNELQSMFSESILVSDDLDKGQDCFSLTDSAVTDYLRIGYSEPDHRNQLLIRGEEITHNGAGVWKETMFDKFFSDLMSVESEGQFIKSLKTFFQVQYRIESGVFLIKKNDAWQWNLRWGDDIRLSEQRSLIRWIEQTLAFKKSITELSDNWTAFGFPPITAANGVLLLKKSPNTISGNINEQIHSLTGLIELVRQMLEFQSAMPVNRLFPVNRDYADRIIGNSSEMKKMRDTVRTIADSPTTVHIHGETGTGKELIARAIHFCSKRKHYPFVAFNCATSSETLIESELFGHKRGAFTGAVETRKGIFQSAQGGTVFLDEISDLPAPLQAKLLRVLQERTVRPLGSDLDIKIDVRIISATHRNLSEEVQKGNFRSDLYYRLVVVNLNAPPLRSRPRDIVMLAEHFLSEAMEKINRPGIRLKGSAHKWLVNRYWHGNVRELQNLMEVAVNFAPSTGIISASDLSGWTQSFNELSEFTLAEATQRYQFDLIKRVLDSHHGNISKSAVKLGISRQTLMKKMKMMDKLACDIE